MNPEFPGATCPVCGGADFVPQHPICAGSRYTLCRCASCTVEFTLPRPTLEDLKQIYAAAYYRSWGMEAGENDAVARMKKATFRLRLNDIAKLQPSGPVLDVGTASGFFLEEAQRAGYEPYGVELSDYSAALAAAKFGPERIHHGTLESCPFPEDFFAVIAMSDLLEHVIDPVDTLVRSRRLLREGGCICITTPDIGSLTRRLMGSRWSHYKQEHLTLFNEASIRRIAAAANLRVVSVRPAWKAFTLGYIRDQFLVYRHPLLTPLSGALWRGLGFLRERHFRVTIGEFVVLLAK